MRQRPNGGGRGRVVVAGCGSIGKRHLRNLLDLGVRDVLAFDPRPDRCAEVQARFQVETTTDFETALRTDVGVAVVCSPTRLHTPMALQAARAGCHLFIEKPLSDGLDGVDDVLSEIRTRRLVTLVGCNFRFHPGLRHVKTLLTEGAIGKVVAARAQFGQYLPDWHPWEDYRQGYSANRSLGGGVVLDRIHEIDYLRWLLGDVTHVCAMVDHVSGLEIDAEDTAEIVLRFQSGAIGSAHLDYVRRSYECSLDVTGEQGTVEWRYTDHSVSTYIASQGLRRTLTWPKYDGNAMYADEMSHFLRALDGDEESAQTAEDAKVTLQVALAAKQAAAEGRTIRL